jgi:hypothetical protein
MTTEQEYIITAATKAKLIDYANAEDAEACIRDILDRECHPYTTPIPTDEQCRICSEATARAATLAILDIPISERTKIKEKSAAMEMSDVSLKLSQRYGAARLGVEASIKVLQHLRKKQERDQR